MFRLRIGTRTRRRWTWPSQTNRNGPASRRRPAARRPPPAGPPPHSARSPPPPVFFAPLSVVAPPTTFLRPFQFFGQPPNCDVAHTSHAQLHLPLILSNDTHARKPSSHHQQSPH